MHLFSTTNWFFALLLVAYFLRLMESVVMRMPKRGLVLNMWNSVTQSCLHSGIHCTCIFWNYILWLSNINMSSGILITTISCHLKCIIVYFFISILDIIHAFDAFLTNKLIPATYLLSAAGKERKYIMDKSQILFTSREAAWSCRSVGQKKNNKKGTYGFFGVLGDWFPIVSTIFNYFH